jgi:hypothetical protein
MWAPRPAVWDNCPLSVSGAALAGANVGRSNCVPGEECPRDAPVPSAMDPGRPGREREPDGYATAAVPAGSLAAAGCTPATGASTSARNSSTSVFSRSQSVYS